MAATYLKNVNLILCPHLFVGLGVAILAVDDGASLGPSLQKGKTRTYGIT